TPCPSAFVIVANGFSCEPSLLSLPFDLDTNTPQSSRTGLGLCWGTQPGSTVVVPPDPPVPPPPVGSRGHIAMLSQLSALLEQPVPSAAATAQERAIQTIARMRPRLTTTQSPRSRRPAAPRPQSLPRNPSPSSGLAIPTSPS